MPHFHGEVTAFPFAMYAQPMPDSQSRARGSRDHRSLAAFLSPFSFRCWERKRTVGDNPSVIAVGDATSLHRGGLGG